ncbi:MAG: hypothetical protein RLZZ385_660 [Pseudomonadota bacterium]|jgi:RNA polymerase sigma-70 factor (ECF subfamily)
MAMTFQDDDPALIAAALNGSATAWDRLVRRYEGRVYNYGLRLTGNATDAMDLMQEVFLGVYRNLHRFRGDARFTSWLFRIAHNKAIDLARRKKLLAGHLDIDDEEQVRMPEAESHYEPDEQLAQQQTNREVVGFLQSLPMEQRMIVELKFYQSMTFDEIAQLLDISENTAKTRFYTALRKLKTVMENSHVLS